MPNIADFLPTTGLSIFNHAQSLQHRKILHNLLRIGYIPFACHNRLVNRGLIWRASADRSGKAAPAVKHVERKGNTSRFRGVTLHCRSA